MESYESLGQMPLYDVVNLIILCFIKKLFFCGLFHVVGGKKRVKKAWNDVWPHGMCM